MSAAPDSVRFAVNAVFAAPVRTDIPAAEFGVSRAASVRDDPSAAVNAASDDSFAASTAATTTAHPSSYSERTRHE